MLGIRAEAQKTHLLESRTFLTVNEHDVLFIFQSQVSNAG